MRHRWASMLVLLLGAAAPVFAQSLTDAVLILGEEKWEADRAMYLAKAYVMQTLGVDGEPVRFEIDSLAATDSKELFSLVYECDQKDQRGLVLGFFGTRWTDTGTVYQTYKFRHFTATDATDLLNKIADVQESESDYLYEDRDQHNVYFSYDGLTLLIYGKGYSGARIRVFWQGFDAEWTKDAFERTKKRLEQELRP